MLKSVQGFAPIELDWTPTLVGIGTGTYSVQVGNSYKIGKLVHVDGRISMATLGTAAGSLQIDSLPYDCETTSHAVTSIYIDNANTTVENLVGIVIEGTNNVEIYKNSGNSAGLTQVTHAEFGATGTLEFGFTYIAKT